MNYSDFLENLLFHKFAFELFSKHQLFGFSSPWNPSNVKLTELVAVLSTDQTAVSIAVDNGPKYMEKLQEEMLKRIKQQIKPVHDPQLAYRKSRAKNFIENLGKVDPGLVEFLVKLNRVDDDEMAIHRMQIQVEAMQKGGMYLTLFQLFETRYAKGEEHDVRKPAGTSNQTEGQPDHQ